MWKNVDIPAHSLAEATDACYGGGEVEGRKDARSRRRQIKYSD